MAPKVPGFQLAPLSDPRGHAAAVAHPGRRAATPAPARVTGLPGVAGVPGVAGGNGDGAHAEWGAVHGGWRQKLRLVIWGVLKMGDPLSCHRFQDVSRLSHGPPF